MLRKLPAKAVLWTLFQRSDQNLKNCGFCGLARAAALQSVAIRRSTGNDVVATISAIIFFTTTTTFSVATFSHRRSARIKKLI